MDTPEEYKEKFKGHWIDESCPNCGGKLISNEMGDVWCGSIICAFGIDDMRGDANVVKKGK